MQWMLPSVKPPRATAIAVCSISQDLPSFGLPARIESPSTITLGTTYLMGAKVISCRPSPSCGAFGRLLGLAPGLDRGPGCGPRCGCGPCCGPCCGPAPGGGGGGCCGGGVIIGGSSSSDSSSLGAYLSSALSSKRGISSKRSCQR